MSRPSAMRTPHYARARVQAERRLWRAIEAPGKLDEELEVQIALDLFAEELVGIIRKMPLVELAR